MRLLKPVFWLLLAITTFLMLIELKPQAAGYIYADKLQHIVVFFMLTLIGLYAYPFKKWVVITGLILFGLLIELSQSAFTLSRQASLADWIADVIGLILALSLATLIKKTFKIN